MKKIIFIILGILMLPVISATPVININYDFNKTEQIDNSIYSTSRIFLRVATQNETNCYYTAIKNAIPGNNFENNWGTVHRQEINNLEGGIHKYYIRCGEVTSPILEITFKTEPLIYGEIKISKEPPLKAGTYELILKTSKPVAKTPKLDYSFDGTSYKPIVLQSFEGIWKGYLIIENNLGEATGSFRFEAEDLSGLKGNELRGDSIFLVDTIKPAVVSTIETIGDVGQIKIKWFYESEFKEFSIYKSKDPNVGYINFYKSTYNKEFIDNEVEKGKTYYYRIAPVDKAGNIADLSREFSATALLDSSAPQTGLRIELRSIVDNFISEIDYTTQIIDSIKSSINSKEQKEKDLILFLKLDKELDGAKSELNSLKRDAEAYKSQDLTKEELENRINSASLKLNIIRKNIPENLVLIEEKKYENEISKNSIEEALLTYNPLIDEKIHKKSVSLTEELIKDLDLKILTIFYLVDVTYFDGTKKQFTIIEHIIDSTLERNEDTFLILNIPRSVSEKLTELNLKNTQYEKIKEDTLLFYSDTKKISYYVNRRVDFESIKDSKLNLIKIKSIEEKRSLITGAFLWEYSSGESYGIIIGIVFFILLGIYLIYFLRNKNSKEIYPLFQKIEKIKELKKQNNIDEVKSLYSSLKEDYKSLNKRQKKIIYKKIDELKEELAKWKPKI